MDMQPPPPLPLHVDLSLSLDHTHAPLLGSADSPASPLASVGPFPLSISASIPWRSSSTRSGRCPMFCSAIDYYSSLGRRRRTPNLNHYRQGYLQPSPLATRVHNGCYGSLPGVTPGVHIGAGSQKRFRHGTCCRW